MKSQRSNRRPSLGLVMAHSIDESNVPATPAIGIVLILLGVLLVLDVMQLETLIGIGAIVIGILVLLGEFA